MDYDYRPDRSPTPAQKEHLKNSIDRFLHWITIPPNSLSNYSWEILIEETTAYVNQHLPLLNAWVNYISGANPDPIFPRLPLIKQLPPDDGVEVPPEYAPSGIGREINFAADEKHREELGRKGEELVVEMERRILSEAGYHDLASEVHRLDKTDGEGYDVLSFFPEGTRREKYIEVKTTEGSATEPFFISRNELFQAIRLSPNYRLYRVYNFDDRFDQPTANFYEESEISEASYFLVPLSFRVIRKRNQQS